MMPSPHALSRHVVMLAIALSLAGCGQRSILGDPNSDGAGDAIAENAADAAADGASDVSNVDDALDQFDATPTTDGSDDGDSAALDAADADADSGLIDAAASDATGDADALRFDVVAIDAFDASLGDAPTLDAPTTDAGNDVAVLDVTTADSGDARDAAAVDAPTTDVPAVDVAAVDSTSTDTPAVDVVPDAATGCGADNTACAIGGLNGLCRGGTCVTCTPLTDDAACTTAYGPPMHLCLAGSCVTANCRGDADCPMGQICGLQTPNACARCTSDSQCFNDTTYGAGHVCNVVTGACVPSTCPVLDNVACPSNPSDVCCGGSCAPGNCCSTAGCATMGVGFVCQNHACSQCDPAAGNTYFVDPMNGNDTSATGSGTTGGGTRNAACAFRTITRALAFIGVTNVAVRVVVLPTAPASVGESFPIFVPSNVTIDGTAGGGPAQVIVPAGSSGFVFDAPAAALTGLVIDGANHTAQYGVIATSGATVTSTLTSVTVQNFGRDGILARGTAQLAINSGVSSTLNGTATARHSGLRVIDRAHVVVNAPAGGGTTSFNGNTEHGIIVLAQGSVALTGTPTGNGVGTLEANQNTFAGLWIQQSPIVGSVLSGNEVNGLVTFGEVNGNGMHFFAGSAIRLRNSIALNNAGSGIYVSAQTVGSARVNDVSRINLGIAADFGHNTVQSPPVAGGTSNALVGICLDLDVGTSAAVGTLSAEGNVFVPHDCSTASPGAIRRVMGSCAGRLDVGIVAPTTSIDTVNCTQN